MKKTNNIDELIPAQDELCLCDSGEPFGACCGADLSIAPRGVIIKHNAIADKKCDELVGYLKNQEKVWLEVQARSNTPGQSRNVRDPSRVTQAVKQGKWVKKISRLVEQGFKEMLQAELSKKLLWYETPSVLFYTAGGNYKPHADAEYFNRATSSWEKMLDRDYSILFYLSDDFEGGNIHFNLFRFSYKPKKGDMVFFPSDSRYMHTAEPVISGNRYAIVSWCAVKESVKVKKDPPASAIHV